MELTSHMRGHSCYRGCDGKQDGEFNEGEHDERKRTGGWERGYEEKREREGDEGR